MDNFSTVLRALEAEIPVEVLQNSLDKDDLFNLFSDLNISNTILRELYLWKNGSSFSYYQTSNVEFCSFGFILPIQESVRIYNQELLGFRFKGLFPFLADYAGDYLLVDTKTTEICIYIYSPSLFIVEPVAIFSNMFTFFSAVLECYKGGIYSVENSELVVDMDGEENVFCECDPTYSKWVKGRE
jgi:hypothetical protein